MQRLLLAFRRAAFAGLLALQATVVGGAAHAAEAATPAAAAAASAPAAEGEPRFDILEFLIDGNTVLAVIDIERAVTPFLGERKTIRDVESARKALEDEYQRRGYQTVFVDIPEQRVAEGEVRLRVLEGRVERLRVTGTRYFALGEIRTGVPELAEGTVPDFNVVQTQLSALNRTADRQVNPVLRAGRTPGTVEVDLAVKDQLPLHGELEVNNRSSAFTTESRLLAGVRWDNLWQSQHSAGLSLQTSPEATHEVRLLVGNYLWRFADRPDVLAMYAVRSDSEVALVGSSLIQGRATIAGARWVRPLPGSSNVFHSLTFGLDYKSFAQTNIATVTAQIDVLGALSYVPLSFVYSATRTAPGMSSTGSLTISTAPSGLFGNSDAEFQGRRVLARAGWSLLRLDLSHEQSLATDVAAWARFEGLWSNDPLVSNEQFTLGGAESVRGYREAELAGDRGARASFELRWWPWRPGVDAQRAAARAGAAEAVAVTPWLSNLQAYALLDAGAVETYQLPGLPRTRRWIGGAGAGLRWAALGFRAQIEAARALNPGGTGVTGYITDKGDWRVHVRLGYDF